ncbi:MAG: YggU family protein [Candidatus Altiarchaeales archaeon WOR_SM1_86-2]|nr:MAG: YggU family protein [Candidatus Altiarchaeales archaeon WOR_SM1_86-2]ODS39971.1 MAG: YggU family protein [Candidatus Altiarchaeales archaeon WOR_SM1_79]
MYKCFRESKDGCVVEIEVVPNSKSFKIGYNESSERLRVRVKAPAVKGKANKAVAKALSGLLNAKCEIVAGNLSKKKTVLVRDCDVWEVIKSIRASLEKI